MGQDMMLYIGAIALGALHAFEPGHGKTLIAAYMIGSRGRAIDGILLGLIVTFTHTFSVIILGIVAKILAKTYSEKQLHGWLGLFSALLILTVGIWMLRQRLKGSRSHGHVHFFGKGHAHPHNTDHHHHHHEDDHSHVHPGDHHNHHDHDNHNHGNDHSHAHAGHHRDHMGHQHLKHQNTASTSEPVQHDKWNLLLLGISGGLVPCPAAIATLLAAIAAGRIGQGLTLAIFFSLGLGLVMMTIGVALSHASKFTKKIDSSPDFSRRMGILSALIITILGTVTLFFSVKTLWF